MPNRKLLSLLPVLLIAISGCSSKTATQSAQQPEPESNAPRIYVDNEVSGDMTIIDSGTNKVIATVPLGKRPRGIHASPDHKTIYIALSGSPIGGPGVDESTLPPADHKYDGIGVFDVQQRKLVPTSTAERRRLRCRRTCGPREAACFHPRRGRQLAIR